MKKKISIVLAGILFLAGLSLLLYPLVAKPSGITTDRATDLRV